MSTIEETSNDLVAEVIRDGHLEIVEVSPYSCMDTERDAGNVDYGVQEGSGQQSQNLSSSYLQTDKNGMMQLDLLNFTLVRCDDEDGDSSEPKYRLMANTDDTSEAGEMVAADTVTCVLQSSDTEDPLEINHDEEPHYVSVVDGEEESLVFLQQCEAEEKKKPLNTPTAFLEKAKAQMKAKLVTQTRRDRRHRSEFPSPHELLASPNFKLYLYSCKQCSFQCNAIKELTDHKAVEHPSSGSRYRGPGLGRSAATTLQCARCPFRAATTTQLMRHVHDQHLVEMLVTTEGAETAPQQTVQRTVDVFVCGACGFESSNKAVFKRHVLRTHNAVSTAAS